MFARVLVNLWGDRRAPKLSCLPDFFRPACQKICVYRAKKQARRAANNDPHVSILRSAGPKKNVVQMGLTLSLQTS